MFHELQEKIPGVKEYNMELENIYELMDKFRNSGLAKLELRQADLLIKMEMPKKTETVSEGSPVVPVHTDRSQVPVSAEKTVPLMTEKGSFIRSPIVGTFYAAPEESAEPYVKAGEKVRKGAVVCIVEAMKMMNEIKAPCDCVIEEVCAANATPVGFEDPLFRIREL